MGVEKPDDLAQAITLRGGPRGREGKARIGLVTIISEEFDAAQDVFKLTENVTGTAYFVANAANAATADWDIALAQSSDRSNVPTTAIVRDMMEDLRPEIILLVGIAGGLCDQKGKGRDGIEVGDVVMADYVSYTEFLKLDAGNLKLRSYPIDHPSVPLRSRVSQPLSKDKTFDLRGALQSRFSQDAPCKIHIGQIVSAEKVLGDAKSALQQGLLAPFDKAIAVDMESIGMARAVCDGRTSFWYHPRYAVIRGISDLVDGEDNSNQRTKWKEFAAYAAAFVAYEFVRRLPADSQGAL